MQFMDTLKKDDLYVKYFYINMPMTTPLGFLGIVVGPYAVMMLHFYDMMNNRRLLSSRLRTCAIPQTHVGI